MTTLLIALLAILVVPLFVSTWRVAVLGLFLQGVLLGLITTHADGGVTEENLLSIVDFVFIRGAFASVVVYRALVKNEDPRGRAVSAPSILSWTLALAVVLLAFRMAARLVPESGDDQILVAVTASAVLLGFLRLATQSGPALQMMAALRIENAIALFEIGLPHAMPFGIRLLLTAVVLATVLFYRWYLATLPATGAVPPPTPPSTEPVWEGPAL